MFHNAFPVSCGLMTWEFRACFEETPSMTTVMNAFCREMPQTVERLGDISKIRMWPLVHFNSQEGRKFRYLVALPEVRLAEPEKSFSKSARLFPRQLTLYGIADRIMKGRGENLEENDYDGNYVFWSLHETVLYVLVFFEGRLCHWSEEKGYSQKSDDVKCRLERLENFIKQDDLFSRGKTYCWQEIKYPQDETVIKKVQRDPFVKQLDLNGRVKEESFLPSRRFRYLWVGAFLSIAIVYGLSTECGKEPAESEIPDVSPTELMDPSPEEKSTELVEEYLEEPKFVPSVTHRSCGRPDFRVKGVVDNRLVLIERDGKSIALAQADSLGDFFVASITRDGIRLTCMDSLEEVPVR